MKNILGLLLIIICFGSCKKNEIEESSSRFMMIHASPNTPDMEFFIDDKPILLQKLPFRNNTAYRDILSGNRNLKVVVSGNTIIDTIMSFDADVVQSFFFYDIPLNLKMKIEPDSLKTSPPSECRVRFHQFVPDATELDVVNTLTNRTIFSKVNLGEGTDWITIREGLYNFELRNSATQNPIYTDWRPDTLEAGKNYTIMSTGFTNTFTNDTIGVWPLCHENFTGE